MEDIESRDVGVVHLLLGRMVEFIPFNNYHFRCSFQCQSYHAAYRSRR
jgi:hypothetical protein